MRHTRVFSTTREPALGGSKISWQKNWRPIGVGSALINGRTHQSAGDDFRPADRARGALRPRTKMQIRLNNTRTVQGKGRV